jgi:hypothetical protein
VVSTENGAKPELDPALLTSNDLRRLKVALDGRNPTELLAGDSPDLFQTMVLAWKLREDSSFTWEQAGDVPVGSVFDMSGERAEPPPPTGPGGSPGPEPATRRQSGSRPRRASSAAAPSSAASSASPEPSTTS